MNDEVVTKFGAIKNSWSGKSKNFTAYSGWISIRGIPEIFQENVNGGFRKISGELRSRFWCNWCEYFFEDILKVCEEYHIKIQFVPDRDSFVFEDSDGGSYFIKFSAESLTAQKIIETFILPNLPPVWNLKPHLNIYLEGLRYFIERHLKVELEKLREEYFFSEVENYIQK